MSASTSRLEIAAEHAAAQERRLRLIDLQGLQAAGVAPPRYIVRPYVPRGVVTLLGGHGGAGKSMLALTIAAHVAAGRRWADLETMPARVLYVSLEDPGDVVRFRLRRIIEACGLDAERVARGLIVLDGTETGGALALEYNNLGARVLLPTAELEELREQAEGCGLIVVDNASDAADFNENDRRMVRGLPLVREPARWSTDSPAHRALPRLRQLPAKRRQPRGRHRAMQYGARPCGRRAASLPQHRAHLRGIPTSPAPGDD